MYEKITLPNGVRILLEPAPGVRSAALGIWAGVGSRHEKPAENGAAHFIEHMLFKGTQRRSAAALAEEMDAIGGQINAYTTKESTCFFGRVLDTHLAQCTDILCDMFFHSRFDSGDAALERGVILEEIGMYEDNPEDLCSERLAAAVFQGSPLARPILGKRSTLARLDGPRLAEFMRTHYHANRIVVALAGSFRPEDVEDLKARFSRIPPSAAPAGTPAWYVPAVTVHKKAIEQNHPTLAFPGLGFREPERFTLQLLSSILGGGMSSRLFQDVRERLGLCYSIYSYATCHEDTGYFGVYTALNRDMEGKALETICTIIRDFTEHGPTQEELDRAREQAKANVLMGLESTQSRMSSLGRGELLLGEVLDEDQLIARYDAVTCEKVRKLARQMFDFHAASLSAVGRVGTAEAYRAMLG